MSVTYYVGDARRALNRLDDDSVACVVTSPPYWGRRSYTDLPDEIGRGSLDDYLDDLVDVFEVVQRKLSSDGLCWLNVGDTAAGSGGAGGDYNVGGRHAGKPRYRQGDAGIVGHQWCDVPGRLLHRLQDDLGWLCRSQIVWDKGRTRPEDLGHVRRPGEQHEMIYMLARSAHYVFHHELLVGRGDVWTFPPNRERNGSSASFPTELPERCIKLSALGRVLDPFAGSGATLVVAQGYGRDCVGVDIDATQADAARDRLGMFLDVVELSSVET